MKIDMKVTTEQARNDLHDALNRCGRGTKEVQEASEKLDNNILEEMLRQDPVIENQYLKRLLKAKDEEIRKLQNEISLRNINRDLSEIAVMYNEAGLNIHQSILKMLIVAARISDKRR